MWFRKRVRARTRPFVPEDNAAVDHGRFLETEVTDRDVIAILLVVALTREADEWCGPELAVVWLMAGHDSLNTRLLAGESKSLPASENLRYLLAIGTDLGLTTDDDEAGRRTLVVESLRLIAGRNERSLQLSEALRGFSFRFRDDTWVPWGRGLADHERCRRAATRTVVGPHRHGGCRLTCRARALAWVAPGVQTCAEE
jgi:hypothetical protein